MIITSGIYRGIPLFSPSGSQTRPTLAKVRQAIFNMIRPYLADETVIDFFSGTGAFGFEALSNGAKKAYFVDLLHGDILDKNAAKLKVEKSSYSFIKGDFKAAAKILSKREIKSGIIFADPPYNEGFIKILLKEIVQNKILKDDGIFIAELHLKEKLELENDLAGWKVIKEKKYGDTFVLCLQKDDL